MNKKTEKKPQTKIEKIRIGIEEKGWSYTKIAQAIETTPQYVYEVAKKKNFTYKKPVL